MHGIGKGRKLGSRNKSKVERLVDMIVTVSYTHLRAHET